MINYDEFIGLKDKKSHITRKYCPIAEKKVVLEKLYQKAIGETKENVRYMDALICRICFAIGLLILYTDVDVTSASDKTNTQIYDDIVKDNIDFMIYDEIGEREVIELNWVSDYIQKSFKEITNSTQEIIRTNVDRYVTMFAGFTNSGISELSKQVSQQNNNK